MNIFYSRRILMRALSGQDEETKQKRRAKKNFLKATLSGDDSGEFIMVAQALQKIIKDVDYNNILTILDKIVLPDGASLEVEGPDIEENDIGDTSKLLIRLPGGESTDSIYDHIKFEDSCMGAWQAFLLHQMWHYLPLWWHALYDKRDYVYSKDSLSGITHFSDIISVDLSGISDTDFSPKVNKGNDKYYVSCCYWTDFGGMKREYAELTMNDGRLAKFFVFDEETLYKYECGIYF